MASTFRAVSSSNSSPSLIYCDFPELAPGGRKYDCLQRHPTWIGAKFSAQSLRHGTNDSVGINAAALLYLVNQRVAVNQGARKTRSVRYVFLLPNDRDANVIKSCIDQGLLDRVDRTIGDRHRVELRRVGSAETGSVLMRHEPKRVVPV